MMLPDVRTRSLARLAVGLYALTLALQLAVLAFSATHGWEGDWHLPIVVIIWGAVGVVLAARRPANWIGWIFLLAVLSWSVSGVAGHYAKYALLTQPGSLPGGVPAYWLMTWTWLPGFVLLPTVGLLLFPDGRLPSPRWRPVGRVAVVTIVCGVVAFGLAPWQGSDEFAWAPPGVENPLRRFVPAAVHGALLVVFAVLVLAAILAGIVALLHRYRRASGPERQQLKWGVFGGIVSVLVYLSGDWSTRLPGIEWWLVSLVAFTVFPLSVAVAILRYHLYDIDRIISRTVSYALITAVLVSLYVGAVLLLTPAVSGVGGGSQIAVAASTLAVAAAFGPVRRRVQATVDRRFNRAHYDAQRTVAEFSTRLRQQTDLDQLHGHLLAAVGRTVEPGSATLWMQPGARR